MMLQEDGKQPRQFQTKGENQERLDPQRLWSCGFQGRAPNCSPRVQHLWAQNLVAPPLVLQDDHLSVFPSPFAHTKPQEELSSDLSFDNP